MIRRETPGHFLLITQHDHALLSGRLAEKIGNEFLSRPEPWDQVVQGITLHDSGWPLHDDSPTLNRAGLPLDVFETPREIGLQVWRESVEHAAAAHPYAGLLVSLHVLALSQLMSNMRPSPRDRFEINKFQHYEIERQEALRVKLGMRTDLPLDMGIARAGIDPVEDHLCFNFRLLQAMDRVSLALCCTNEPFHEINRMPRAPGGQPWTVALIKHGAAELNVEPWLFDCDSFQVEIGARRLPHHSFASITEFQDLYRQAAIETLTFQLHRKNTGK
jgi:hypothetical protein